jgi:hypothetical protein
LDVSTSYLALGCHHHIIHRFHIHLDIQLITSYRYSEEYIGIIAANIPCLKSLLEKAFHELGGRVTNITSSNSKNSNQDLDDYPHRDLNYSSYKPYPTRMEENLVNYHTSLREMSRLGKLQRLGSQEDILLKMKRDTRDSRVFEFELELGEEKKEKSFFREVDINGRRIDRYTPR